TEWLGDTPSEGGWRPMMSMRRCSDLLKWIGDSLLPADVRQDLIAGRWRCERLGLGRVGSSLQRGSLAVGVLGGSKYCLVVVVPRSLYSPDVSLVGQSLWKVVDRSRVAVDGRVSLDGAMVGRVKFQVENWVVCEWLGESVCEMHLDVVTSKHVLV